MTKLTKSENDFYSKNYDNVLLIVQKVYSEFVKHCDQEGLQWLRSNLNKLGRNARASYKQKHGDVSN